MFGACRVRSNIWDRDRSGGSSGKGYLSLFSFVLKSLHCKLVAGKVNSVGFLEFVDHPVNDTLVEVVAAQTVVSGCGKNFGNAVAHFNNGNVESTAAKVVNHNGLILFLVNTVGKSRSRRLVDDTSYGKTRDLSRVLCGLPLSVGEVSGNCDNSFCNGVMEISLRVRFKLLEDHCGDLLRGVLLAVNVYLVVAAHVSFNGSNGSARVCNGLVLSNLTHKTFACFCEAHNGGSSSAALCVCDNGSVSAFNNSNAGVCST